MKNKYTIQKYFNKVLLFVVFIILMGLFASIVFFVKNEKEARLIRLGDTIIKNFRSGLDYEKVDLLSFSMALAEDGSLKNALISEDESKGHILLSNISQRFKKYTHLKSLRIQVFTPEFYIFARSWNEGFEGMPIWWFRDDLDELTRNKEPKVGMETGRLLTFKATIPMHSGDTILGYLEVIKLIDEFSIKLRDRGIELFALMDEKFLKKAELMRDFPVIDKYIVSNQNYNQQIFTKIKMFDWDTFMSKKYYFFDGTLYIHESMYNGAGEEIGLYLLVISDDVVKKFENTNETISFFTQFSDEDIKQVVKSWAKPYGSFRNHYDKSLIEILPKLQEEDKKELLREAKTLLRTYKKEELIDIILHNKHQEKKIGAIK